MVESACRPIRIDLNQFKLHLSLKPKIELSIHFDSPSRMFYLSVTALVVNEMKRLGRITSIPMEGYVGLLALLNETIGGSAGSSSRERLLPRIYRKWKDALPHLEEAPLFKVLGRKKEYDDETGRNYRFSEEEKDSWANLFEYKGSQENVRLRFSIDKVGASLDDVEVVYGENPELKGAEAWECFLTDLRQGTAHETGHAVSQQGKALSLPDKPSIAVLPFQNLSGNPKEEYFSDGLTEGLITNLSKVPNILVVARNSSFAYKHKPVKVQAVAEDLGIRYVLEGSIQKTGGRVRITAQLIDALEGYHIWSETYDRKMEDIFAIQDKIALEILKALDVKLTYGEGGMFHGKGTNNLEVYLKFLKARDLILHFNRESNFTARRLSEEVIRLDPDFPSGYHTLAVALHLEVWFGSSKSPNETFMKAIKLEQKAISLDDGYAPAHAHLGTLYVLIREYEKGIEEGKRAVEIAPNLADGHAYLVKTLSYSGRPEEALAHIETAFRLNPVGPPSYYFLNAAVTYRIMGRYADGVKMCKDLLSCWPDNFLGHVELAMNYAALGCSDDAQAAAKEALRIDPNFSAQRFARTYPHKDPAQAARLLELLRKAGLPD
jgi:adenylate cyclase